MTDIKPVLEPEAAEFCKATDTPPFLYQLPPAEGRKAVDEVQSGDVDKPAVDEEWVTVEGGPTGSVRVRIVKPVGVSGPLPVVFYIHGAGWVFGNAHTHDRLVRELAVGAEAAVVFPDYDLSPEAKYPTAIEQNYAAAQWVFAHGAEKGLDASRFAVAGDSVGGDMAAVLTLMAKDRGDVTIAHQVLLYPVTAADFDTPSYHQFAEHYFLTREGMKWFWINTPRTMHSATRSTPLPCGPPSTSSQACHRPWSSPPRPTCCVTAAKPTPPNCAPRACRSPRFDSAASSTTS